jgi:hypothetical protein
MVVAATAIWMPVRPETQQAVLHALPYGNTTATAGMPGAVVPMPARPSAAQPPWNRGYQWKIVRRLYQLDNAAPALYRDATGFQGRQMRFTARPISGASGRFGVLNGPNPSAGRESTVRELSGRKAAAVK